VAAVLQVAIGVPNALIVLAAVRRFEMNVLRSTRSR